MEEIPIYEVKPWYKKIKDIPAAYYLVALQLLVFILLHIIRFVLKEDLIIANFAKNTYYIAIEHEYYRLLTSVFIHESIPHFFFNAMALIYLAKPIEAIFGKSKFLIIFLVSGLFGSLASFIFSPGVSIGASGGVFGIFGVHLYLYLKNKDVYLRAFGKNMMELLILNVILGFVLPNIDYWGHFGGILGGFLVAVTFGVTKKYTFNRNFFIGAFLSILLFIGSFSYFNNNFVTYNESVENLATEFNQAITQNDLVAFEKAKLDLISVKNNKPFLPPHPSADLFLENLEESLKNIE